MIKGNSDIAVALLWLTAAKTVMNFLFGVIPLFVLMGLLVSAAGLGRDTYDVAHYFLKRVRGGLGMATVVANAIFAAITGVSIASATVFSKIAVPEMLRYDYNRRFAVGTVAGSSVLGMLIPPSILLIIYALIAEESVGDLFIAGVGPGLLLTFAYCVLILVMAYAKPKMVSATGEFGQGAAAEGDHTTLIEVIRKMIPISALILIVLGGIYGGLYTPTEAGAAGAVAALVIALWRRTLTPRLMWDILVETGHITAFLLFLIISASMYSRMLGISGLPTELGIWITSLDADPDTAAGALRRDPAGARHDHRFDIDHVDYGAAVFDHSGAVPCRSGVVRYHHHRRHRNRSVDAAAGPSRSTSSSRRSTRSTT